MAANARSFGVRCLSKGVRIPHARPSSKWHECADVAPRASDEGASKAHRAEMAQAKRRCRAETGRGGRKRLPEGGNSAWRASSEAGCRMHASAASVLPLPAFRDWNHRQEKAATARAGAKLPALSTYDLSPSPQVGWRNSLNVVPAPRALSTRMRMPYIRAIWRTMARPRPVECLL